MDNIKYNQYSPAWSNGYKEVRRDELIGYRSPTEVEHSNIIIDIEAKIRKQRKVQTITQVILSIFIVVCILALLGTIIGNSATSNILVLSIAIVICLIVTIRISKYKKHGKEFLYQMYNGQYKVLECKAYNVGLSTKSITTCDIYIYNNYQQKCIDKIIGSKALGIACKNGMIDHLLLMTCNNTYEIYGPNGINH